MRTLQLFERKRPVHLSQAEVEDYVDPDQDQTPPNTLTHTQAPSDTSHTLNTQPSTPNPELQTLNPNATLRPLIMVDDNLHSIPFYYRSRLFSATR